MQEGCVSLMQMAKTSQAVARMAEEGVLFISLLTDPTYGGVSASYATLGDVLISEPGAHIGFAGPSVIEQTIHQQLPAGFQTAEFLLEHGNARHRRAPREPAPHAPQPARAPRPGRGRPRRGCAAASSGCRRPRVRRPCPTPTRSPPASPGTSCSSPGTSTARGSSIWRLRVRRVPRAPRRPPVPRGPGDHRRSRPARRADGDGHRPAEGPHDERADGAQLRHARARGLPQGHAPDALRRSGSGCRS